MSSIEKQLKEIEEMEQKLHKQIDDEVKREEEIDEIKSNREIKNESSKLSFRSYLEISIKMQVKLETTEESAGKIIILINGEEKSTITESGINELEFNLKQDDVLTFVFERGEVEDEIEDEECYMSIRDIQIS